MIALDDNRSESDTHVAGNHDLGDFRFDDELAEELGSSIVRYSKVIQELIKDLFEV